ncbi:metallophosphoesterase family protein, partial [Acidimangrovimonas sediminis]|uniref:metallophosphoesterase family protein n=1 Tax=Acidimangrovimonas sediminis TaxID=2056283 RepID=UPI000C8065EC
EQAFIAIGDIHGSLDQLDALLAAIERAGQGALPLVFVGDYIDRGMDSLGVLRRLHGLQQERGPEGCICLLGNHEQMLLDFLENPRAGRRWLSHGGLETLLSCALPMVPASAPSEDWEALRLQLLERLGPGLCSWIEALPVTWSTGNVAVVHAGADPATPLAGQQRSHLVWGHPDFFTRPRQDGQWVVHGHTIQPEPTIIDGRIGIDTGAYGTGRLTAALVRPGQAGFLTVG